MESAKLPRDDRRLGVLYLDGKGKGSLVSPGMQSTLESLAAEASIAIENARLYREAVEKARVDQELRVAAAIQRALLPQSMIRLPYAEAAAVRSRAARSAVTLRLSGYDGAGARSRGRFSR